MEDPSLKSSDSGAGESALSFVCNICGRRNEVPVSRLDREVGSCDECGSTVRTRAVIHMIAREMFGRDLSLPEFPVIKGLRGIGMSDSPEYANRLGAKFSYTNTFYHKEPLFDIVNADDQES